MTHRSKTTGNGHAQREAQAKRTTVGVLEWFRPGEEHRVDQALADLRALGVKHLRTGISWADWHTPDGPSWYSWLLPRLASEMTLLPCALYTPPSLGIQPKTSSPPRQPQAYADFIDLLITDFGSCFDWIELWNEPNNIAEWDWTLDQDWHGFSEMIGKAAYWAHKHGKKTLLGGISPPDANFIRMMGQRGVTEHLDAIGIHGFPGAFEAVWDGWAANIERCRTAIDEFDPDIQLWITETGYSTWRHDERRQVAEFLDVVDQPVDRVYWYALHDLPLHRPTLLGSDVDPREYHFGLKTPTGRGKLLWELWSSGGIEEVKKNAWVTHPAQKKRKQKPVLITGGAGFIGSNLASHLLEQKIPVLVYDNLTRRGVHANARWLKDTYGDLVQIEVADVRDRRLLEPAVQAASRVFHLAAQVAVTTSLVNPREDFEINTMGALNVLEAIRACDQPPPLLYTSTNKVYGALPDVQLMRGTTRYEPRNTAHISGMNEERCLDFHSPYGCSKGAADQYVLDYARSFNLPTVVFRMSCIYGPHQFGNEDQGWIAHMLISTLQHEPVTIYGDGKQVRDALFVDDLVRAMLLAQDNIGSLSGQAFNIGGGADQCVSLLELLELIEDICQRKPSVTYDHWRTGDQRYYVSDIAAFERKTGWRPQVSVYEGIKRLRAWLTSAASYGPAIVPITRSSSMQRTTRNGRQSPYTNDNTATLSGGTS